MRTIQIIYRPGYGGHFLRRLFSLSLVTKPLIHPTYANSFVDSVAARVAHYSYINAPNYQHWSSFHAFQDAIVHYTNYNVNIVSDHPFSPMKFDVPPVMVSLSVNKFANYWLETFRRRQFGFPNLTPVYIAHEQIIKSQESNLINLNLDKFLFNTDWEGEYVRISNLLGIPVELVAAKTLYDSWYKTRVSDIRHRFDLGGIDHEHYANIRANAEIYGTQR